MFWVVFHGVRAADCVCLRDCLGLCDWAIRCLSFMVWSFEDHKRPCYVYRMEKHCHIFLIVYKSLQILCGLCVFMADRWIFVTFWREPDMNGLPQADVFSHVGYHIIRVPEEGGDTHFVHQGAAFDALPKETLRLLVIDV